MCSMQLDMVGADAPAVDGVGVVCRTKKTGAVWGGPQYPAGLGDCGQRTHLLQLQSPGMLSA